MKTFPTVNLGRPCGRGMFAVPRALASAHLMTRAKLAEPICLQGKKITLPDGSEVPVDITLMGEERAYEDYAYLGLLQREWNRMQRDVRTLDQSPYTTDVSLGAPIVLIFWTYFETRIDRFWVDVLRSLPSPFSKDLLDRYSSIKARLGSFYKTAFNTTYYTDLEHLGYPDLAGFLGHVMEKRNRFAHGDPVSINDELGVFAAGSLR